MSRIAHRSAFSILVATLWAASTVPAQVVGYTGQGDEIVELRLSAPGEDVAVAGRWSPPGLQEVRALERDTDGTLYAWTSAPISVSNLYAVDLAAETAVLLRSTNILGAFDLAFDDDGLLWMASVNELYTYDVDTDTLTLATAIASANAAGIAWWQGELYMLGSPTAPDETAVLGILDPTTGTLSDVRPVLGLEELFVPYVDGIDFDDDGGLWVGITVSGPLSDPPFVESTVAYYPDPSSPVDPTIRAVESPAFWPTTALVVGGSITAVEVPTASGTGLAILAALLGALALVVLRRRASHA